MVQLQNTRSKGTVLTTNELIKVEKMIAELLFNLYGESSRYFATLSHEMGHLTEGTKCGMKFAFIRVANVVVYKDVNELRWLLINAKLSKMSHGVCFVYHDDESTNKLLSDYQRTIEAGPVATEKFYKEQVREKRFSKLTLMNARLNNPVSNSRNLCVKVARVFKSLSLLFNKGNDQHTLAKLRKNPEYVVKLNDNFKNVGLALEGKITPEELNKNVKKVVNAISEQKNI